MLKISLEIRFELRKASLSNYIPKIVEYPSGSNAFTHEFFFFKVTLLVNNAGIGSQNAWEPCLDVMLKGVCRGVFLGIEKMSVSKGKKGGRIINIASMAGLMEGTYVPGMYIKRVENYKCIHRLNM